MSTTLVDTLINPGDHSEELSSTAKAVHVSIGALVALVNGVAIVTLAKCKYMRMQMKILIGSLVAASFLTGFVSVAAYIIMELSQIETYQQLHVCATMWQGLTMTLMFSDVSSVTALAVECALCQLENISYKLYATKSRLMAICLVAILWITNAILGMSGGFVSVSDRRHSCIYDIYVFPLTVSGVTLNVFVLSVYICILLVATVLIIHVVRKQRIQVAVVLPSHVSSASRVHRQDSMTVMFYICAGLVVYLPIYIQYLYLLARYGSSDTGIDVAAESSRMVPVHMLVLLRGLGNAVLLIWRMKECRIRMLIMFSSCSNRMRTRTTRMLYDHFVRQHMNTICIRRRRATAGYHPPRIYRQTRTLPQSLSVPQLMLHSPGIPLRYL
jgi:hypothetical protein